jgi:hypothetical protein
VLVAGDYFLEDAKNLMGNTFLPLSFFGKSGDCTVGGLLCSKRRLRVVPWDNERCDLSSSQRLVGEKALDCFETGYV